METVTGTGSPPVVEIGSRAMCARTRSAILNASGARVCGSSMTNSSPPNRPARSYSRSSPVIVSATWRSTSSPMRCP